VDADAVERARRRVAEARDGRAEPGELAAVLERARTGLESLAETAAGLEASVPDRVAEALREGLRAEVLPVGRHLAEVRGLSGQTIRRLERLQADLDAERGARIEDLALLVDLVTSGWKGVERRLDRLERCLDRVERALEDRGGSASVYPLTRPGA
jgi:hypothetical protein